MARLQPREAAIINVRLRCTDQGNRYLPNHSDFPHFQNLITSLLVDGKLLPRGNSWEENQNDHRTKRQPVSFSSAGT